MSDYNGPGTGIILTDITNDTVYSTDIHYEVNIGESNEVTYYAEVYNKYNTPLYSVRTQYNSSNIVMESFENDKFTPYPIKYELLYKVNDIYVIIDEVLSETGTASFDNLIKGYTYYIKAIDPSNKYVSKVVPYIPTEYNKALQPLILTPYENLSYDKFQYNFIVTNILGEKDIYLDNNNSHIKLENIENNKYKITLSEIKNKADEFDLIVEDIREDETIKVVKHILINDGFSTPYNLSANFTESGSVIFKWNADGKFDTYKFYTSNIPNEQIPTLATGLNTYVSNSFELYKDQYIKVETVRGDKSKASKEIKINAVDPYFENNELLLLAESSTYPSTSIIDLSNNKNTITNTSNNVTVIKSTDSFADDGYFNFPSTGCSVKSPISLLGSNDLTAECYIYISSNPSQHQAILHLGSPSVEGSINLSIDSNRQLWAAVVSNSQYAGAIIGTTPIPLNTWTHICVMKKTNKLYLFLNGNLLGTDVNYAIKPILNGIVYIGCQLDTINTASSFNGLIKSIRISNIARYTVTSFTAPSNKCAIYSSIKKPESISYRIASNNDLIINFKHTSNNVDNYSVYMSDTNITNIDGMLPVATITAKRVVIPNFDVYNNYDKTLKIAIASNKYNSSYLSDNKDLYVAYDWTPDNLNCDIYLDANDITTATATTWTDKKTNAIYTSSGSAITVNTINDNKALYFNNTSMLYCLDAKITSLIKQVSNPTVFIVWNKTVDYTDSNDKCMFRFAYTNGSNRFTIYSNLYNTNKYGLGGRKISTNNFVGAESTESSVKDKIYMTCNEMNINNDYIKLYTNGSLTRQSPLGFEGGLSSAEDGFSNIGGYTSDTGGGNGYGHIGNIFCIIYNKNGFTTEERQKLEGWAAHKYGLTDNLPSDHPYKTKRPIIDHTPINLTSEFKND